jgi:hypothetical protein
MLSEPLRRQPRRGYPTVKRLQMAKDSTLRLSVPATRLSSHLLLAEVQPSWHLAKTSLLQMNRPLGGLQQSPAE